MTALSVGLLLSVPAAAQTTIFNTKDFHQDKSLWTDPAYYRNNTPGQLAGMALNIVPYQASGQVGAARLYAALLGHVSFYPGRMDACWLGEERVRAQAGDFYGGWITSEVVGPFKGGRGTSGW